MSHGFPSRLLLASGAFMILSFVPGSAVAQSGEGQVSLAIGTTAPDVVLEDLDGNELSLLSVVDGRPALLEFWATWCENCEALQPQLDQIHEAHGDDLAVVAVAVAVSQSQRRVRRHVEDHGAGYPYLWDGRGDAVRAYKATTTSVVVLLDADGTVAYTGVGGDQDLVGAVGELLGG
ncbi:MAG: TlpA family protein disulfide reductase [Gemmatimonadetes bacterium]|nr:TlpA family protein disulfide reductase [Gemmatimonadota bacterium]